MKKLSVLLPLSALVMLAGCVTTPVGPAVRVMPGTGKSFDQFQADEGNCLKHRVMHVERDPAQPTVAK